MFHKLVIATYLTVIYITEIKCHQLSSIETNYNRGVEAYSGERWTECINRFEDSLHLNKLYKSVSFNCRYKCNTQEFANVVHKIQDLWIYELFLKRKFCLLKCLKQGFKQVALSDDVSADVLNNIRDRKPYEYIHICYFQMYMLPKAASAAYTFLAIHPDNKVMRKNFDYYITQQEVDPKEVVDLESSDFVILYKLGKNAYENHNWGETVAAMEEVLSNYLQFENICRAECEEHAYKDGSDDFTNVVADNMEFMLYCKQNCQHEVQQLNYKSGSELISDVLNYLQMSYYHLNRTTDGAMAVASYLYIYPNDEDMLENKKIYSSLVGSGAFTVRNEIFNYIEQDYYEKTLLEYIEANSEHQNEVYFE